MLNKKYAVVDFGTNSARLMIANVNKNKVVALSKTLDTIRLGEKMNGGIITNEAIKRAINSTTEFLKIAKAKKADEFYCFATSAVREAKNTEEFVSSLKGECGVDVEVISGEDEAKIGFLGATQHTDGNIGLLDIGGGSTEVVLGLDNDIIFSKSYLIGTVRLLEKYSTASTKNLSEFEKSCQQVREVLSMLPENIASKNWIGIGGTVTALAAIDLKLKVYDAKKVDGHYMSKENIIRLLDNLKSKTVKQRKRITGLDEKRADVIVFGALILYEFLDLVNVNGIRTSESDNLEGYLIEKLNLK